MKEANKGLYDRAKDAITGVIKTILELKNLLMGVLARAAGAIEAIIADPIKFLGNLVAAVKQGLGNFMHNIGAHLQKGLLGWLFGALGDAGIELPASFDLKGILSLVMQVVGLTYANIRGRAVKAVGEPTVRNMEKSVGIFQVLASEGPAGLWRFIKDKIGDLKDTVIEGIKNFVIERIVVAGITWLVSLFNPAGAFIKACKAIYDVIMFFIERGSQIMALVNAVLNSVSAIASGSVGGAAAAIEAALSAALPVAISFLANLLGLGGISEKIKSIIGKVRAPVEKAVDWVIGKAVAGLKKAGGLFKGKGKGTDPSKDAAKGTAPGGTPADPKAAGTPQPTAAQPGADARTPEQKKADLDAGVAEADKLVQKEDLSDEQIRKLLPTIKAKYHMTALNLVIDSPTDASSFAHVHGAVNPEEDSPKRKRGDSAGDLIKAKAAFGHRLFSRSELSQTLGASKSNALSRINEWIASGVLFQLASDTFDPETEYSFDAAKAGQRETNPNNRAKYGYHPNPEKKSPAGLEILSKGLRPDSPPPIERTSSLYHQQKARYHSMRPGSSYTNFGWPDAILGHKMELGASEHWNRIGHTQSKAQNRIWNQNPANYHGPEHTLESSASGPASERYRVPSKSIGSHPDWW